MAKRILIRRDTAQNWYDNNPMLYPGEIGVESDTLKIKVGPPVVSPAVGTAWRSISTYVNVVPSDLNTTLNDYVTINDIGASGGVVGLNNSYNAIIPGSSIIVEGTTANAYETTLSVTDPTADRTITFPDSDGTVALTSDLTPYAPLAGATFTGNIQVPTAVIFEGATADSYETTLQATDPTADRTITIPDVTGTIVTTGDTATVTNAMLAGSIANNKLSNSSVTINGYEIALGASASYGTDNISEGTTNKYFTDERAQDAVAAALAAGTHTNITVSYNDNANSISLTGAVTYTDENAQDAIGNNLGTGLSYDDASGAISVNTSVIAPLNSPTFTGTVTLPTGTVTSGTILDGTIVNDDINASAAIALSKLATDPLARANHTGTQAASTISDFDTQVRTSKVTDLAAPTSSFSMSSQKITNLAAPTSANDAANKSYVDNIAAGLNFHAAVHAATTTNLTATYSNGTLGVGATLTASSNGALVVDSHTMAVDERILVKNQTTGSQNGIYVVTATGDGSNPWILTRATDADNSPSGEVAYGDFCFVQDGTSNGGYGYILNTTGTVTIGTTSLSYTQFNAGQSVVAGNGLTESSPGTLAINTSVTADLSTAQTLTNKTLTSPTITGTGSIAGTFTGNLTGNVTGDVSGNAGTVTNGVYTTGTYSNPSWLTSLAWSKISSTPTTIAGYGITDPIVLTSGTYSNPSWITGLAWSKISSTPTTLAGYGITDALSSSTAASTYLTQSNAASTYAPIASPTFTGTVSGITKSMVGLGNVENTALSTWAGSTNITTLGTIATGTWSGTAIGTTKGGTGLTSYTTGDVIYASGTNTLSKLSAGTEGYLLTISSGVPVWAAAPVSLPSQTGNTGKFLTTNGSTASWADTPIITGTATISANTATTIDTNALAGFTSVEYMVSLKQGSKVRTSKVIVQTDGTSVDMTEFAITETGGSMAGVVVSASVVSTNMVLQVTVTDAASTNVAVKFSEIKF